MNDLDHATIGYRQLRALIEDLLRPPPLANAERLRAALQELLRQQCQNCGELIDQLPRQKGETCCYACVDETPRRSHDDQQGGFRAP